MLDQHTSKEANPDPLTTYFTFRVKLVSKPANNEVGEVCWQAQEREGERVRG